MEVCGVGVLSNGKFLRGLQKVIPISEPHIRAVSQNHRVI